MARWQDIAVRLGRFFARAGAVSDHLILVRIPLLLVAAGMFLTLRVDQISEFFFLFGKGGERPLRDAVSALAMTFLLGLAVWYSSRVLYRFRFAPRPALADPRLAGLRKWLPRALGASVPLLMAIGCIAQLRAKTADAADHLRLCIYAGLYLAEAVAIAFLVFKRRALMRAYERYRSTDPGARTAADPLDEPVLHALRELQPGYRFFQLAVAANGVVFVLAAWSPATLAGIGTLALIQLTALFFVLTGTWVLSVTERCAFPVLTVLLAAALGGQLFLANDNHHVRQTAAQASYHAVTPQIANLRSGREVLARRVAAMRDGPVFLVSAEGGGMRAAAWTALVLARLDHLTNGAFGDHLVAASGVSGGSLGIATYTAMRRMRLDHALDIGAFRCARRPAAAPDVCPARDFLTRDFLRPVLTNMLIVDQAQRWLPVAFLPDRGSTLERAWERAWEQITHAAPGQGAFTQAWSTAANTDRDPWLLFNTTVVSSGQRLIEQPFAFDAADFDAYFPGAINGALRLQDSAPLSAVVHNSARFTYMSPAGTLDPPLTNPPSPPLQVVDGGYFENSGTATLLGVYRLLTQPGGLTPAIDPKRIYVIHISNDPLVPAMRADGEDVCLAEKKGTAGERAVRDPGHVGEFAAPLVALLNTREARGELARQAIVREVQSRAGDAAPNVLHFRLCRGDHHLPLGWTLSDAAWTELTRQLGDVRVEEETRNIDLNVRQLDQVRELMGAPR